VRPADVADARRRRGPRRLAPFAPRPEAGCTRSIAKHVRGEALALEEVNPAWELAVHTTWDPSRS
ncbi:MAG TPA: hypothetical protein VFD59_02045, partial [Nocardioidaceae bacterium]|nr:hypothetical protein [Nocardioidaceae bacterium]